LTGRAKHEAGIEAESANINPNMIQLNDAGLDSFQYFPGSSLELLEIAAFPFASRRTLKYPRSRVTLGF